MKALLQMLFIFGGAVMLGRIAFIIHRWMLYSDIYYYMSGMLVVVAAALVAKKMRQYDK